MKHKFIIIILSFSLLMGVWESLCAQCNSLSLVVSDSLCLNENFGITNNTAETFLYEWDFCPNSAKNALQDVSLTSLTGASQPFGLDFIEVADSYYIFIINRGNGNLLRLKFLNDISDTPTITNLGNLGGSLPQGIAIKSIGSNFYGLITKSSGEVLLLDFGNSIENVPSVTSSYTFSDVNELRGISIVNEGSNYYAVIAGGANSGVVTILNFGNSLSNTPTELANRFDAGRFPTGLSLYRDCEEWYGVVAADLSSRIYKFSYGGSLINTPEVFEVQGIKLPRGIALIKDFDEFFAYSVSNFTGNLMRFDFGTDFPTGEGTVTDLGDLGVDNWAAAYQVIKINGSYYSVAAGFNDNQFLIRKFDENCDVSVSFDDTNEPSGVSYTTSGWKKYEIRYTDGSGLTETVEDSVYVRSEPTSNFSVENKCTGQNTSFTDLSSADNLAITDWLWDFDDPGSGANNTSTLQNPSHVFDTPGTYNVSLEVTDACGQTITAIIPTNVVDGNDLQVDFSTEPLKCSNDPIQFTDETTFTTDTPDAWLWDFDGLGSSADQNPTFTFPDEGDYDITLTVTGESGCSQMDVQTISIIAGPSPNFTVSDACVSTLFDFTNTTTGDNIVSYEWDFDNGFMSSEENPEPFEYDSPGTYNVTLTTENSAGCITSIEKSLTVYDPPVVDFTNDLSCELDPTQFTDMSTVNNANIESWQWDFGDPASESNTSTEQNPQHIFSTSGDFNVRLITTTTFGCIDSLTQVVSVNQAPSANFSFDKVCIGEEIQFQDESEAVPGEQITNWAWNLGGEFSSQQNPTATFDFAIDYNVSLTITSQNLCSNTFQDSITVFPAKEVGFKVDEACENVLVHLYDTTQQTGDPIASRVWQFADQGTAMDSSVFNDFSVAGEYDVNLAVTTERGCEYDGTQTVTINEAPEASFEASKVFGAPPLQVDFTDNSSQATSHFWDFGDGNTSNQANPGNTFTEEGSYNVSLAIEDINGCRDTTSLIINALVPELELELQQVTIVDKNIILTIINNGTLSIDSMRALINLGDRVEIEENIIQSLPSSNNPKAINYTLDLNLASRKVDYVCVTLTPILSGAEDSNSVNNTKCKNFESDIIFIKPYPNPAKDDLNITIMSETEGAGNIRIISSIGEIVLEENFEGVRGKNDIQLDVSSIKGGVYLVEVEMAGFNSHARVAIDN